jgi:TolB-like protein
MVMGMNGNRPAAAMLVCLSLAGLSCSGGGRAPAPPPAPAAPIALPASAVVSVLPFDDRTRRADLSWLRRGMPDAIVAALVKKPSLIVVQRERTEEVMREQAFQLSGHVADDSAVRIGHLVGATVLVSGSVALAGATLKLNAQVIDVERGIVLGTASAEGPAHEVTAVMRGLALDLGALFSATGSPAAASRESWTALARSVEANARGESLSREGRMFQALEEFERALLADPANVSARSNYSEAVRALPGSGLADATGGEGLQASDWRVADRMVERLVGSGLMLKAGRVRFDKQRNGTQTLRLPVELSMSPEALAAVSDVAGRRGGEVVDEGNGLYRVRLSDQGTLNRHFVESLRAPHRVYLRLLTSGGRTLAVYSRLATWRPAAWVTFMDEQRVRIHSRRVIETEVVMPGLSQDQAAHLAAVRLTVDAVPREQASVRVESVDPLTGHSEATPPALPPDALRDLQAQVEQQWDPPILERAWTPGYLPGNEHAAIVTCDLGSGDGVTSRMVRSSGESVFDAAALAAIEPVARNWRGHLLKVRIQFRVRNDIPSLNLVVPGAAGQILAADEPSVQ